MTDDPRALEPCKLWLAVGAALAQANRGGALDLSATPVMIATKHPIARVTQRLLGRGQEELRYSLEVFTEKPGPMAVTYRERTQTPVRGPGVTWDVDDAGNHASAEVMGKSLDFVVWRADRGAAVQRMLVESPFMRHAHVFGTEAKLSWIEYGHHRDGGMGSKIEGEWRGSNEDVDARRERMGFVPWDDRKGRALSPDEYDALPEFTGLPSGIVLRDIEHDARMELRGAVTLEVQWGVTARPRTRA